LYLKNAVLTAPLENTVLAAPWMDSMDSLNRLNPVDDNDKLEQVKLTSSLFGFPSSH